MSFTDIKTKSQGFTIVELLIVVVVIAILAAITIVSYNGITGKANQSASKAAAATLQKKTELYFAEVGNYPVAKANLSSASTEKSYYLPAAAFGGAAPTADTSGTKGTGYAQIQACVADDTAPLNATAVTGAKINYWSYDDKSVQPFATLGSCAADTIDLPN